MTCLNERIVGAIFFMLSGYAFAEGLVVREPLLRSGVLKHRP